MEFQFCIHCLKKTLPRIQILIAEFCNHLLFLVVFVIFLLAKAGDCNPSKTGNDYVCYIINHVKNPKPAVFLIQKRVLNFYSLQKTDDSRTFSIIPIAI